MQDNRGLKLSREIATQTTQVRKEMDRLIALRVEQELLRIREQDATADWIKPELLKIRTVTDAILNALEHHPYDGLRLNDFEKYVTHLNLPFHKPTITSTLGRLKRDDKVIRESGGYWKIKTIANRSEEEGKTQ